MRAFQHRCAVCQTGNLCKTRAAAIVFLWFAVDISLPDNDHATTTIQLPQALLTSCTLLMPLLACGTKMEHCDPTENQCQMKCAHQFAAATAQENKLKDLHTKQGQQVD